MVGGFAPQTHLPPDGAEVGYHFLYFFPILVRFHRDLCFLSLAASVGSAIL